LGGIGFGGFNLFSSNKTNEQLRPLFVESFNFNVGLRYNYFLSPTFYIGLQSRFNLINYNNRGGTSFNGNAFSFDIIFGGTARRNNLFTRH